MGRVKQLLPLGDKPVIRHCLDNILSSGITDIIVVLGPHGAQIADVIRGFPVTITLNRYAESEMAESVRLGLKAIDSSSSGVLICLSDHPLVSAKTFKSLLAGHAEDPDKIIVPLYNGRRAGHPTLFPRHVLGELYTGLNLRDILKRDPDRVKCIHVADEGVILDMDTVEDYEKIDEYLKNQRTDK
ncbi:MAG: nucleotidyltransferase family protein [Thermodesulfovibrionales bacterium]|jgi:molybdenum cofactor cytidylyltransferase